MRGYDQQAAVSLEMKIARRQPAVLAAALGPDIFSCSSDSDNFCTPHTEIKRSEPRQRAVGSAKIV